jgi:hypothetical protein
VTHPAISSSRLPLCGAGAMADLSFLAAWTPYLTSGKTRFVGCLKMSIECLR